MDRLGATLAPSFYFAYKGVEKVMKVLVIEPHKPPYPLEIDGTLAAMKKLVGRTIQAVYPFEEPIALVCNDEGKLLGLPLNRALYHPETDKMYDIIAGTFFLCGAPPDADSFTSLTNEQLEKYTQYFHTPETFIRINGKIVAIPEQLEHKTENYEKMNGTQ